MNYTTRREYAEIAANSLYVDVYAKLRAGEDPSYVAHQIMCKTQDETLIEELFAIVLADVAEGISMANRLTAISYLAEAKAA